MKPAAGYLDCSLTWSRPVQWAHISLRVNREEETPQASPQTSTPGTQLNHGGSQSASDSDLLERWDQSLVWFVCIEWGNIIHILIYVRPETWDPKHNITDILSFVCWPGWAIRWKCYSMFSLVFSWSNIPVPDTWLMSYILIWRTVGVGPRYLMNVLFPN